MSGYTTEQLEEALVLLWDYIVDIGDEDLIEDDETLRKNDVIYELLESGKNGYAGIGLGKVGGHAIGDE